MSLTRAYIVLSSGAIILDTNNTLPDLAAGGQQYQIRVRAVAISREEMDWLKQGRTSSIGHAYSGTIDAARIDIGLPVSTNVYGMAPIGSRGAAADYINACDKDIAILPDNLTYEQAATIPLAAFVAWHTFSVGNLDHHPDLLIYGAETAVGRMVDQIVRVEKKQQGWAVYPKTAKPILFNSIGSFETIESLPKCEIVIDCMSHGPKLASWMHTKEGGTLITTAPYSSTSRGTWPSINVREVQVEHLPKKMPMIFGETMDGSSLLSALKSDVIDFDDPEVPRRIGNIDHNKQIVLRLSPSDSDDQDNLPTGAVTMQRSRPEENVVDLTSEGNGSNNMNMNHPTGTAEGNNNAVALTREGNGEHDLIYPTGEGVGGNHAIAPTSEGNAPTGEAEEDENNAMTLTCEGNGNYNVDHPVGQGIREDDAIAPAVAGTRNNTTIDLTMMTDKGDGDDPIELSSDSEEEEDGTNAAGEGEGS